MALQHAGIVQNHLLIKLLPYCDAVPFTTFQNQENNNVCNEYHNRVFLFEY